VLLLSASYSYASKFGFAGSSILLQPIGARQISLGESFTAVADDLNTIYYNPSGLTQVNKELSITYIRGLSGTYYTSLSLGKNIDPQKSIGVTVFMFNAGSIEIPIDASNFKTVSLEDDYLFTLSYAKISEDKNLSLGFNMKYLSSTLIEKYTATALMSDFGLLYKTPFIAGLNFGLAVQNIGTGMAYGKEVEPLPMTYRTGLAYKLPGILSKIRLSADIVALTGCTPGTSVGLEYIPVKSISFRAGYRKTDSIDYFSIGFGLYTSRSAIIDYGQKFSNEFDTLDQFTLSFGPESTWLFGSDKKAQIEEKETGNTEIPLAKEQNNSQQGLLPKTTQQQIPVLEKEIRDEIEDELVAIYILIKNGYYMDAKRGMDALVTNERKIKSWEKLSNKINLTAAVLPDASEDKVSFDFLRKGLLAFMKPIEDPKNALLKTFYALEISETPAQKENARQVYDMLRNYYPDIAKSEQIPDGFTLINYKLYKALDSIYKGEYDTAITQAKEVLGLEPNNVLALKRLGSALYALGKAEKNKKAVEEGRKSWKKALELAPNDGEIKEFLKQK